MSTPPDQQSAVSLFAPFQERVKPWMDACFGSEISGDKLERNDRFIEEALELAQATGYDRARAHALVDYVFDRPEGEPTQEVGGVMVTLAALCLAHGLDMDEAAENELARIWTKVDQIRAKQAAKPTGSALPVRLATQATPLPQDQEWQPIETAPKDGSTIVLWNGSAAWVASWDRTAWDDGDFRHSGIGTFTHWMPLSDPPAQSRYQEAGNKDG